MSIHSLQGLPDVRIISRTAGQHRLVALSHMPQTPQKKVSRSYQHDIVHAASLLAEGRDNI